MDNLFLYAPPQIPDRSALANSTSGGLFDQAPTGSRVFKGTPDSSSSQESFQPGTSISSDGTPIGTVFSFAQQSVTSRVGISFISSSQACRSVEREMPSKTSTLTSIVNQTKEIWNTEVLSKVTTTDTNLSDLQHLYTSLYIMHQLPSNRTGENSGWQSQEPYFDDIYTMWDLFRTSMPLLQILQPDPYEQLIRSMVDVYRNDGYLPNARSANFNGPVQGGSNSDVVLADAYIKGVRGAVNWKDAYAAMVKNAEVTPVNNLDPRSNDSSTKEGRGALPDWLQLGFITPDFSRSVSRGIEYAGNDFGLYQVALGEASDVADIKKYWQRSQNWRSYWNANATSLGFSGFVGPRTREGFVPHEPLQGGGYWADPLYQGSSWEYSFNAHHDVTTLVEWCGGPDAFVARLQTLFEYPIDPERPDARLYSMSFILFSLIPFDQMLTLLIQIPPTKSASPLPTCSISQPAPTSQPLPPAK
jgi:putative alpha-1,2-mannosidase